MSTHFAGSPSLSGSSVFPSDGESDGEQDFMDQDFEHSPSSNNGKEKPSTVQKPAQKPPLKNHTEVFPNMAIPIPMTVRASRTRTDHRGVVNGPDTLVPTMMVQCPFPGGTVVTETTDPVQKISWGPITRVEASQEARDLAKEWRKVNQTNYSSSEEAPKVVKKPKRSSVPRQEFPSAVSQGTSVNPPQGPGQDAGSDEPPSLSTYFPDTETHDDDKESKTRRRSVKPPPPTPPSAILYDSLSMPTLPILHNTSNPDLVETYRLQRAKGPSAFDKETRSIKRSLVQAKIDRGGDAHLLNNEYTVELASREVAAIAEKWANGRIAATRTRSSTMEETSRDMAELVSIMGGETANLNKHEPSLTNGGVDSTGATNGTASEAGDTLAQALNADKTGGTDSSQRSKKRSVSPVSQEESRRKIKSRLLSFDLPSHVSKMTTHGNIRHQHFVKREVGDHGEKRTVTTWIRIEEVYEVPAPEALKWEDVMHATKPEKGKELLDKAKNKGRKRTKASRVTGRGRGRHMTATSSKKRAGVDDDSIDDCESISGGSGSGGAGNAIQEMNPVSQTASLLHSLGTSPHVQPSSIAKLIKDFEVIIETLTENDNIRVEEEG